MTLDSNVYPTRNARASHIQGSHGNIGQVQDGRRQQCRMQSSRNYVQFYHPQYYLTQDTDAGLCLPPQSIRYPDVHLAALEAPCHDHTVPTNHDSLADWASNGAVLQHGRRHCRRKDLQPSGGDYSRVRQPPSVRTLPWNKMPPSGHTENYTIYTHYHDQGIYSQIQEQGSNEQYKTHQRRSKSADSYYGNYANHPSPSRVFPRDPTPSRRPVTRDARYTRISSRSAPTTPGYRSPSRDYPRDRRSGTTSPVYNHVTYEDPRGRHAHYHTTRRSATPTTPNSDRSKRLSTPGTPGTYQPRATTETPGADYRSYLTSSLDVQDGSGQPFIISDVSSVFPGSSSLMTSSNQMPSSMVTSLSLQVKSSPDRDDENQCHHHLGSRPESPDPRSPEVRHQRSLSDGAQAGWRDPQRYLFSGPAPLAENRVEAGIYSPRTVEFMNRYIADEDNKARRPPIKKRLPTDSPHLPSHPPHLPAAAVESSPEELAYTREKLDQAVRHVRWGRLQPSYGHSAPELDVRETPLQRQHTPRARARAQHCHSRSSEDLIGSTRSQTDSSLPQSVTENKGDRSGSRPISAGSNSGRGSGSHFAGRKTRSHDASQSPHHPLFEGQGQSEGQHYTGAPFQDSSQNTSGLGSKDTSRTLSSLGGTTGTGSDDHMTSRFTMHSPRSSIPNHEIGPTSIRPDSPHFATQETSGDENYEFDTALAAELVANLHESGVSLEGAGGTVYGSGLQSHSPSPERIDPNESMEDKFERLRREYREFQGSSQENLSSEAPPTYTHLPNASHSSLNELESETL